MKNKQFDQILSLHKLLNIQNYLKILKFVLNTLYLG